MNSAMTHQPLFCMLIQLAPKNLFGLDDLKIFRRIKLWDIGLLLCRKKNKLVAEYALRGMDQSIAVAAWKTQLAESLPEELRGSLPTIKEIEAELARDLTPESP